MDFSMPPIGASAYHAQMESSLFEAMERAWGQVAARFEAYRLVIPGSPGFICQPDACTAHCCHAFSVNLGDTEVARMQKFEGLEMVDFLELDEDRQPVTLPMVQPFLLARADNHCKMLGKDLRCTTYHGRPNACRLYPHFVVFWDAEAEKARTTPSRRAAASFDAASKGKLYGLVPVLLGHVECPGFTGPPIAEAEWFELFRTTYQLQYAPE